MPIRMADLNGTHTVNHLPARPPILRILLSPSTHSQSITPAIPSTSQLRAPQRNQGLDIRMIEQIKAALYWLTHNPSSLNIFDAHIIA